MFTKLRSVLEWCFLSTSTVNETFFRRGNKSARRVRNEKAPFRFPTSGVRFLPSVAPYPSLPIAGIRFREKRQANLYVAFQDLGTCSLEEEPKGPLIIFTFFWEGIIEHTPLFFHNIGEI